MVVDPVYYVFLTVIFESLNSRLLCDVECWARSSNEWLICINCIFHNNYSINVDGSKVLGDAWVLEFKIKWLWCLFRLKYLWWVGYLLSRLKVEELQHSRLLLQSEGETLNFSEGLIIWRIYHTEKCSFSLTIMDLLAKYSWGISLINRVWSNMAERL